MLHDQPIEYRSRTHEARGFWHALRFCHRRLLTDEQRAVEFAGLDDRTQSALWSAGVPCQRVLMCMPNWLLRTVPGVGSTRMAAIRRVYPFNPKAWLFDCPNDPKPLSNPMGAS